MPAREQSTLSSTAFLGRLKALVDARLGLRIRTHRPPPLSAVVVATKRAFRLLAQPLINEVLEKQTAFNKELVDWSRAVTHDIEAVERSVLAMRTGLELRLTRLDAAVARLEKDARASSALPGADLVGPQPHRPHN